nr:MAG TPA: hypothetical protein [Bacteriophage sp.]
MHSCFLYSIKFKFYAISISCCIISVCCGSKLSKRVQLRTKIVR